MVLSGECGLKWYFQWGGDLKWYFRDGGGLVEECRIPNLKVLGLNPSLCR